MTVTVFYDPKTNKWAVQSDDFNVSTEYFATRADAEQFAADMQKNDHDADFDRVAKQNGY